MSKNPYKDLTLEQAIELLKEKDGIYAEQAALLKEANEENILLNQQIETLKVSAEKAGALPSFNFDGKNYSFTAKKFHMKMEEELVHHDAALLAADLTSKDDQVKKTAQAVIAHIIKSKMGVIKEEGKK